MFPQIPFVGWIAVLSNGETMKEEPPIPGEKTSWQKLIDRLYAENLKMIGLRLQNLNMTITTLPPSMCDGYYQAREARVAFYAGQDASSNRRGIGSVVGDRVYIVWIDGNGNVWSDVRLLSDERIHTTLRDSKID